MSRGSGGGGGSVLLFFVCFFFFVFLFCLFGRVVENHSVLFRLRLYYWGRGRKEDGLDPCGAD